MDDWTRFAVTWFSEYKYSAGPFGDALSIATAKNVSVDGVEVAGIVESGKGKVRILRPSELDSDWNPGTDRRITVWEIVHHLIRILKGGSEADAAEIIRQVGGLSNDAKALCYRIFNICEQKGWADEGRDYNLLMTEWSRLQDRANQLREVQMEQEDMFE